MSWNNNFLEKKAMTLWMGDLDDTMDEATIASNYLAVGETVTAVKIIKNRLNGQPAGYCFVEFPSVEASQRALLRLNGKPIPNTDPPKRFKLNTATKNKDQGGEEWSVFVGDLTEEVDDYMLYEAFQKRYPSTKGAKVVLGQGGVSRGFGFVRFGSQQEQLASLREMQSWPVEVGGRTIRVSSATPKKQWEQKDGFGFPGTAPGTAPEQQAPPPDWPVTGSGSNSQNWEQWNQYYQQQQYWQYQQQYAQQWGEYYQNYQAGDAAAPGSKETSPAIAPPVPKPVKNGAAPDDPNQAFDVEASNARLIARSEDFLKTLDESQWFTEMLNFPCITAN